MRSGLFHDREKPRPLGRGLALGVQGGRSAPARGWGESPILGIELSAEGEAPAPSALGEFTEDFLLPYIFWPALGLANGLLQYLLLRRYLPRMGWWVAATALGWSLALFGTRYLYSATLATTLDVNSILFGLVKTLLTGGTIGLAQWFVLRQRVQHAAWWILANVLGWGISAILSRWLDLWVFGVPAIATVVALWLLLDQLPQREVGKRAASQ